MKSSVKKLRSFIQLLRYKTTDQINQTKVEKYTTFKEFITDIL